MTSLSIGFTTVEAEEGAARFRKAGRDVSNAAAEAAAEVRRVDKAMDEAGDTARALAVESKATADAAKRMASESAAQARVAQIGRAALDDYVKSLRTQREAMSLSANQIELLVTQTGAQAIAAAAGIEVHDDVASAIRREVEATQALREEQERQESAAKDSTRAAQAGQRIDEIVAALKREREAMALSSDAREQLEITGKAEALAKAGGIQLSDEHRIAITSEVQSLQALREEQDAIAQLEAVVAIETERNIEGRLRESAAMQQSRQDLDAFITGLKDERSLQSLDAREREIAIAQRRAEQLAMRAGITDRQKVLDLVRQEVRATQEARATSRGSSIGVGSLTSLLPNGGGVVGTVVLQAQQGASALTSMAAAGGLTAAQLGLIGAAGAGVALTAQQIYDAARASVQLSRDLAPIAQRSAEAAAGLHGLGRAARDLAADASKDQDEIAKLLLTASEYGLQSKPDVLRVATTASNAGLGEASEALARLKATTDAFNLEPTAGQLQRVADSAVAVARAFNIDPRKLTDALAQAGAVTSQYGVELETVEVLIAKVANRTGDYGGASRAVSNIVRRLADDTDDLHKTFAELGVDLSAQAFQGDRLIGTLSEVNKEIEQNHRLRSEVVVGDRNAGALLELTSGKQDDLFQGLLAAKRAANEAHEAESRFLDTDAKRYDTAVGKLRQFRDIIFEYSKGSSISPLDTLGGRNALSPEKLALLKRNPTAIPKDLFAAEAKAAADALTKAAASASDAAQIAIDNRPLHVAFDAKHSSDELHRAINLAIERLSTPSIPVEFRLLPDQVDKALELIAQKATLPEAELSAKTLASVQKAYGVVKQYGDALAESADLSESLQDQVSSAYDREANAIERNYQKTLRKIDAEEQEGVVVARLRQEAQRAHDVELGRLEVRRQGGLDTAAVSRLQAVAREYELRQKIAETNLDGAAAEQLTLDVISAKSDAIRSQEAVQANALREANQGNAESLRLIEETNAARERGNKLEADLAVAAVRRAAQERAIDRGYRATDLRTQALSGLDAELAQIKNGFQRQRDEARREFNAHPDDNRSLIEQLEFLNLIEAKERSLAKTRASLANEGDLLNLRQSVARSYEDQLGVERESLDVEARRLQLEFSLRKATEEQNRELDLMLQRQRDLFDGRKRMYEQFGATDIGQVLLEPELDFNLATVDLQIKRASEPIVRRLEDAFANPDLSADELEAEIERAREQLDKVNQLGRNAQLGRTIGDDIGEGVARGIKDIHHLGSVALDVARQIEDAFLQAFVTKPIANWASGLANSFLNNLGGAGGGVPSALGNVFSGGEVVPFGLGGLPDVGNEPALFRMPSGRTGSIREGGKDEGIFQLARGPGGVLGVRAFGGGAQQPAQHVDNSQHFQISMSFPNVRDTEGMRRSARQVSDDLEGRIRRR